MKHKGLLHFLEIINIASIMYLPFFQRVINGEANYGRQILAISSTDGKAVCYNKLRHSAVGAPRCYHVNDKTTSKFSLKSISYFLFGSEKI
jgi:hypothetical protein